MTQLFDWKKVCAEDVARPFPPVAGRGRGKPLEEAMKEASRRAQEKRLGGVRGRS